MQRIDLEKTRDNIQNILVKWEIELDADSPIDAAIKALAIQRNPESIATVFSVNGEEIDLWECESFTKEAI